MGGEESVYMVKADGKSMTGGGINSGDLLVDDPDIALSRMILSLLISKVRTLSKDM